MKGGSFMANTEIFLRNIFGTTRPNIRPLVLALNITNDLLFEQHISMSDIKATKHIYPDVARLLLYYLSSCLHSIRYPVF